MQPQKTKLSTGTFLQAENDQEFDDQMAKLKTISVQFPQVTDVTYDMDEGIILHFSQRQTNEELDEIFAPFYDLFTLNYMMVQDD